MVVRTTLSIAIVAGMAGPATAEQGSLGEPKMLIHGNYCGPGNNAPRPPIDALDAACARHDACTPVGAMPSRTCNARLMRDADAISQDPRQSPELRAMAGIVAAGAALLQNLNRSDVAPVATRSGASGPVLIRP